jgi:hemoglobin-like flavoprotein
MTPRQIKLVRSTWTRISSSPEQCAHLFYKRLFAIDPALRGMFRTGIGEQSKKLTAMLQCAVDGLERPTEVAAVFRALGRRHHHYGVSDTDYDKVRDALLWMVERSLAGNYTAETGTAWRELYERLAAEMKAGACDAKQAEGE